MKKITGVIALVSTLFLSGCSTVVAQYSALSSRSVSLENGKKFIHGSRVKGSDSMARIIIIPVGQFPTLKDALENALGRDRCAVALTDVTVRHQFVNIPFIFGIDGISVEGRKLIDTGLPNCH